tara:strand:+ start:35 stop:1765 length:1731 start_codon:yes stop_codon:yes gene_type:complete
MESSSVFNPGFLGSSFNWWIGQVPDDSYWRDNIVSTKSDNPEGGDGWGYRYKVRIIGLHDRDEESIPSDQLPWAQVMYPVTAGGGQASSFQTPNIRQGMFVFGFFLDGADMQVPVIMGVLGNNGKTRLQKGTTNFDGISGYLNNDLFHDDPVEAPDSDKKVVEPQGDQNAEIEAVDQPHTTTASDVVGQEKICEKIPLKTPENQVQSSIKNMQTEIEKVTEKISKYMNSITSYADAVSFRSQNPQILIKDASKVMAKYTKPIMDQMMAHSQKKLNEELTKVVSALPSSERYLFSEMKEEMNEMALCLYNKVTNNLSNKLEGLLLDALDIDNLIAQARGNASDGKQNALGDGDRPTTPVVPTCAAEDIMASVIVTNMGEIQENNDTMLQGVNEFLNDISDKVSGVLGIADQVSKGLGILGGLTQLPNINTSMGAAMLFNNLSLDVFGCEVKPNEAVSDEYTFCGGGSSKPDAEITDPATEDKAVADADSGADGTDPDPGFAGPTPDTPDVSNKPQVGDKATGEDLRILNEEREFAAQQQAQQPQVPSSDRTTISDVDAELERARRGDRSGLDDALDF